MIKKSFILLFSILIVSCEKESENSLLTSGKWILEDKADSMKETVQFNKDNTYIIETEWSILTPYGYSRESGQISGNWIQQGNTIQFITSEVYLPDDITSINDFPVRQGDPVGSFFGYVYLSKNSIDKIPNPDTIVWDIKSLTKDSLIIECKGKIQSYHHE